MPPSRARYAAGREQQNDEDQDDEQRNERDVRQDGRETCPRKRPGPGLHAVDEVLVGESERGERQSGSHQQRPDPVPGVPGGDQGADRRVPHHHRHVDEAEESLLGQPPVQTTQRERRGQEGQGDGPHDPWSPSGSRHPDSSPNVDGTSPVTVVPNRDLHDQPSRWILALQATRRKGRPLPGVVLLLVRGQTPTAHAVANRYRCQRSGTPFSSCSPASSKLRPEPGTRSFTVWETRTSTGQLAPRPWRRRHGEPCDVIAFERLDLAGVQAPARTSSPTARTAPPIACAHRTPRAGPSNVAKNPSPAVLISVPRNRPMSARTAP